MRIMRRNLDAEWSLQRERYWERARALRALRNAVFFLLFGFAVLALAMFKALHQEEVPSEPARITRIRSACHEGCR